MSASHFDDWRDAEPETVAPGVGVLIRRGSVVEVARIALAAGSELKEHAHPEEQFFYMLEGALRYRVGAEERVATPGTLIHMPADVPHWGRVEGDAPAVFIEVKQLRRTTAAP